jgi:hypothetical protein
MQSHHLSEVDFLLERSLHGDSGRAGVVNAAARPARESEAGPLERYRQEAAMQTDPVEVRAKKFASVPSEVEDDKRMDLIGAFRVAAAVNKAAGKMQGGRASRGGLSSAAAFECVSAVYELKAKEDELARKRFKPGLTLNQATFQYMLKLHGLKPLAEKNQLVLYGSCQDLVSSPFLSLFLRFSGQHPEEPPLNKAALEFYISMTKTVERMNCLIEPASMSVKQDRRAAGEASRGTYLHGRTAVGLISYFFADLTADERKAYLYSLAQQMAVEVSGKPIVGLAGEVTLGYVLLTRLVERLDASHEPLIKLIPNLGGGRTYVTKQELGLCLMRLEMDFETEALNALWVAADKGGVGNLSEFQLRKLNSDVFTYVSFDAFRALCIQIHCEVSSNAKRMLEDMFKAADDNGDGVLELWEFTDLINDIDPSRKQKEIARMFMEAMDVETSVITPERFAEMALNNNLLKLV